MIRFFGLFLVISEVGRKSALNHTKLSGTSATESYIKGNHHSKSGHMYVANHMSYTSYTQMVFGPSSILTVKVRNRKGTERGQPSFFIVDRDHLDFVVFNQEKNMAHDT